MKTPEGKVKMAVLGDGSPGAEEYLQHLNAFLRMLARKKCVDELTKFSKAVVNTTALVRKLARTPGKETEPETSKRLSLWEAAEGELKKADALETVKAGVVYDFFRKTLKEDPELQWDRIVDDMHAKDPWEDLRGVKHIGLRRKSIASLWDCIDFHKLTVLPADAAEKQRFYVQQVVRQPTSVRSYSLSRLSNAYVGRKAPASPTLLATRKLCTTRSKPRAVLMQATKVADEALAGSWFSIKIKLHLSLRKRQTKRN